LTGKLPLVDTFGDVLDFRAQALRLMTPPSKRSTAIRRPLLAVLLLVAARVAAAQVVVNLPNPQVDASGRLVVQPNVSGTTYVPPPVQPPAVAAIGAVAPVSATIQDESLPPPPPADGGWPGGPLDAKPMLPLLRGEPSDIWLSGEPLVPWDQIEHGWDTWTEHVRSPTGEAGLGRERVAYAPFEIDITQPFGNFLWRTQAVYDLTKPDRAEAFWARPGRGPLLPESSVDYQEFRLRLETGSNAFSLATDVPIRLLNPEQNDNTGGIGDIELVQKTRLIDGNRWQMTQLLRTVFNSGNAKKGLGTGHVSMEPGMLWRYRYSDITFLHSELKMTFPVPGTPGYAGPLLKWGIGVSHVWYETDTTAYIPTLEFTNIWVLDGQFIPFPGGLPVDVRGDGIFNLAPGLRVVHDTGGDVGVVEFVYSGVFAVGSDGWYDALLRFDLRFVF